MSPPVNRPGRRNGLKKLTLVCLVASLPLFVAATCGGPHTPKGSAEAETVPPAAVNAPANAAASPVRVNYFFDRTESMWGFIRKGDDSEFVKALPGLWIASEIAFPLRDEHIFEYGESTTDEFTTEAARKAAQREVLLNSFYGFNQRDSSIRTQIKKNGGQPFTAVAGYVNELHDKNTEEESLSVIVTDLYEQGQYDPFSRFYRESFARGLSGAFFAVESSFSGVINSVSRVNVELKSIQVRDGKSTFFICIAGDSARVAAYCAELAKEFTNNNIQFESSVFIVNPGTKIVPAAGTPEIAGNIKRFSAEENAFKHINIRQEEMRVQGGVPVGPVESWQLLTNTGSRWAAGLNIPNINPKSFTYQSGFLLSHFKGVRDIDPSQWTTITNSKNVETKMALSHDIPEAAAAGIKSGSPLYLAVETKTRALDKGWHKVEYRIIPEARTRPQWVLDLNAQTIGDLEASAGIRGGRVKTLQLANVYEKIAEAYNGVQSRSIYTDEINLLKR